MYLGELTPPFLQHRKWPLIVLQAREAAEY